MLTINNRFMIYWCLVDDSVHIRLQPLPSHPMSTATPPPTPWAPKTSPRDSLEPWAPGPGKRRRDGLGRTEPPRSLGHSQGKLRLELWQWTWSLEVLLEIWMRWTANNSWCSHIFMFLTVHRHLPTNVMFLVALFNNLKQDPGLEFKVLILRPGWE